MIKVGKQLPQHETPLYSGLKKHADRQPVNSTFRAIKGAGMDPNSDNLSEKTR